MKRQPKEEKHKREVPLRFVTPVIYYGILVHQPPLYYMTSEVNFVTQGGRSWPKKTQLKRLLFFEIKNKKTQLLETDREREFLCP